MGIATSHHRPLGGPGIGAPSTAPSSPRLFSASGTAPQGIDKYSRRVGHIRATISFYSGVRQLQEVITTSTNICPNGGFFYGSANPPAALIEDLSHVFHTPPVDAPLRDSKAHQLLVAYCNGWYAIPSPVNFSRHAGTCLLLGDRSNPSTHYSLQLGDCIRLGSVGLVVVAMRYAGQAEKLIDPKHMANMEQRLGDMSYDDDEASRFVDEKHLRKSTCNQSVRTIASDAEHDDHSCVSEEAPLCYMCYDPHDDEQDPLVAPCDCRGDTRYVHVACLQRWYQNLGCGPTAVVIRTTANGAPACKICGAAYKTAFRDSAGKRMSIVEASHTGPYISFVVVTRHENSPQLFNTKFRLNFKDPSRPNVGSDDIPQYPSDMTIGRSSACNMVLDYRTVSTMHARMAYQGPDPVMGHNGGFILQDLHSSNGSLLYLQRPHFLGNVGSHTVLRLGRTTMALDIRGSTVGSGRFGFDVLASCVSCKSIEDAIGPCSASPDELYSIMSHPSNGSHDTTLPVRDRGGAGVEDCFDTRVREENGSTEAALPFRNDEANADSSLESSAIIEPVIPRPPYNVFEHAEETDSRSFSAAEAVPPSPSAFAAIRVASVTTATSAHGAQNEADDNACEKAMQSAEESDVVSAWGLEGNYPDEVRRHQLSDAEFGEVRSSAFSIVTEAVTAGVTAAATESSIAAAAAAVEDKKCAD